MNENEILTLTMKATAILHASYRHSRFSSGQGEDLDQDPWVDLEQGLGGSSSLDEIAVAFFGYDVDILIDL